MSFLAPFFLFGLLAAAIPLAIHLIRREKPPRVPFASLRFLKATTRKLVLFQQIQQWLLLLLRAALICLLVFAFARPLFYEASMAGLIDSEPQSTVLLVDVSMSMQHGERFERMQQLAREEIDGHSPGDELAVIRFASSPQQVRDLTRDHSVMRAFIDELPAPGYEAPRFYPALRLADELLERSQHENRRIVMFSNFQAEGMNDGEAGWMLSPGVTLQTVDLGEAAIRNLSIADLRSPAQLIEGVTDYEVLARIRSTGTTHLGQGRVHLRINDEPVVEREVDLGERSEVVVNLPVQFEAGGSYAGEVSVSGDEFEADNHHYFTVDVMPRIQALVVNGSPSDNWYEDAGHWFVLALEGVDAPYDVSTVRTDGFEAGQLNDSHVLVLLDVEQLADSQARAVVDYVNGGGSLLIAPGAATQADALNRQLEAVSPAFLEQTELLAGNDYLLIADRDRRHPILSPLDVGWDARFQGYWQAQAADDSEVLMRFDNNAPALIERGAGEGRALMFTSTLDTNWSNLPLQGLYLPFVHEMVNYLAQPQQRERAYRVGESIDLSPELGPDGAARVLRDPDGREHEFSSLDPLFEPRQPGFIRVGEQEEASLYAVNVQPGAGNMERIPAAQLHDRIINPETTPRQSEQVRTAQLMSEMEQPQSLWWWVLLLVLLLLPLETLIANRTYR